MMNMYRETEKKPRETLSEKIDKLVLSVKVGHFNRIWLVNKVTNAINKVDVSDTKNLQQIANIVASYDLESLTYGKALSQDTIEKFVSKVIMNQNHILSESMMDYYLKTAKLHNEAILQVRRENSPIAKFKQRVREAYESSIIYRHKQINRINKEVKSLDYTDTKGLTQIVDSINKTDLLDGRLGKTISADAIQTIIEKAQQNGNNVLSEQEIKYYNSIIQQSKREKDL